MIRILPYIFLLYQLSITAQKDTVLFEISQDAKISNSQSIANIIKSHPKGIVIKFEEGVFHFSESLHLKSNVHLIGTGNESKLIFDCEGKGSLIIAKGSIGEVKPVRDLLFYSDGRASFSKEQRIVLKPNDYIKLEILRPPSTLSDWAQHAVGKIAAVSATTDAIWIDKIDSSSILLNQELTYQKLNPVRNVALKNLSISRIDATAQQTANISLDNVVASKIENIHSHLCNYAHISMSNCADVVINNCFFEDAFAHGNGGKAYGVVLQYTTSNCRVASNTFKHLRHAIVLQAGAIDNGIVGNYCMQSFWEDVRLPKGAAGDIVLHGNYPSNNWIAGNVCNQIVVDNSHGMNGPNNVIYRNKTLGYGIYVNSKSVDGSIIISHNDIVRDGFLQGRLQAKRKTCKVYNNRINGKVKKNSKNKSVPIGEMYSNSAAVAKIGIPFDFWNGSNTAYQKYAEGRADKK